MAKQLPAGTDTNYIDAHNDTHRAVVGLEASHPHYDGPEVLAGGVQLVPPSAPTTLAGAVNGANSLKAVLNDHFGRHNAGTGRKVYAHKVADATNVIVTAEMAAGSTFEAALLATLATLVAELRTRFEAHRSNKKPDGTASGVHAAADSVNILGGLPTLSDFAALADGLNLLKATFNAHITSAAGGSPHPNADNSNAVTAPNADAASLDSLVVLANQLRTKFLAHLTQSTVHAVDDTFNTVGTSAAAYPAGLFTLANELRSGYEAHRASTSFHESADSTNTISAPNATTVATLIALVAELCGDVDAHLRAAPVSSAVR